MNNSRALLIVGFVFIIFFVLISRLFDIQILKSDEYKYFAAIQQTKEETISGHRGLIYDRNKVLLVYNKNDYSFYVYKSLFKNGSKNKIIKKFAKVFNKSESYYRNLINDAKPNRICIEKKVPAEKALELKNFRANGLSYEEDPTRVYSYNNLASHVLGFVGTNYKGVNGIAKSFNNILSGKNGKRLVMRDAIGDMITVAENSTKPAKPGDNLVLTINKTYQTILEEELKTGVKKYEGTSGIGIIMDPNNGQVLALANVADFNPNKYWDYKDSDRRDRAITDTYEPGSTFKGITMSALLNEHLCRANEKVNVENGRYRFKGVYISDTHRNSWLTVKGIIEESSNVGMSKLVQRIDKDRFYKYMRAFGFGNYTAIPLPGEAKGYLRKPNDWSAITKEFMSFGYGLSVTPIQLITAYSAIINGGILYQPELILREEKNDGTVIMQNHPQQVRRVISEQTSAEMRNFLIGVVKHGTGRNAQISFMNVGGKTGTSQKLVDGKYSKSSYNSSFIGFFPANQPKIICLILVNAPKIGRYGGSVAAPIFKNIALKIANTNMNDFRNPNENLKVEKKEKQRYFAKVKFTSNSKRNSSDNLSSTKILDLNNLKKGIVPNLKNLTLRDAILVLSRLGVKYKVTGSGKVVSQSINPGTKLNKKLQLVLTCKVPSIKGTMIY